MNSRTRLAPRYRRPLRTVLIAATIAAAAIGGSVFAGSANASTIGTSGANGTHDPSRMIKDGNRYYVYSTGGDIPMKYSTDMTHWTTGKSVFPNGIPSSVANAVPNFNGGNVWAPDVIHRNGVYRLYYAVWGDKSNSAIALATSPTLDPNSSSYKWTNQGIVIKVTKSSNAQAIDPGPFYDHNGNDYLTWGSGYPYNSSQPEIFVTRLNNSTGLSGGSTSSLLKGHEEASYEYYHNGYYYLFWNSGSCCSGASSTYTIHVARSTSATGGFSTRSTPFLSSFSGHHGPGQIGIYSSGNTQYYTYHYYPNSGGSVLGLGKLTWGSDGWPNS